MEHRVGEIKKYQSVYMSEQGVSLNKFANDVAFPGHSDAAQLGQWFLGVSRSIYQVTAFSEYKTDGTS
jgi:hypothetical protein